MTRRRLQVRAESQQTAIAILHHELAAVPWHVAKSASEFHALGGVLGIKCVGIFNEQKKSRAKARPLQNLGRRLPVRAERARKSSNSSTSDPSPPFANTATGFGMTRRICRACRWAGRGSGNECPAHRAPRSRRPRGTAPR